MEVLVLPRSWRASNSVLDAFAARERSDRRVTWEAPGWISEPGLCERGVYDAESAALLLREISARWRAERLSWVTLDLVRARSASLALLKGRPSR